MDNRRRIRSTLRMELDSVAKELDEIENAIDAGDKSDDLLKKRDDLREYHKKLSKQYEEITGKSVEEASKLAPASKVKVLRMKEPLKRFNFGFVLVITNILYIVATYAISIHGALSYSMQEYVASMFNGLVETRDQTVINKMKTEAIPGIATIAIILILFTLIAILIGGMKKSSATVLEGIALFVTSVVTYYGFIGFYFGYLNEWDAIWPFKEGVLMLTAALGAAGIIFMISTFLISDSGTMYRVFALIEGIIFVIAGAYVYIQYQNNGSFTSHFVFSSGMIMLALGIGAVKSLFLKIRE